MTYLADRTHAQYAGTITRETMLKLVRDGKGRSGPNADYVLATRDHLRGLGILDPELEWLAAQLRAA